MMPRMDGRVSSGRDERRAGERRSNQAKTRGASESATGLLVDNTMDGWQPQVREVGMPTRGGEHGPVTFWTTDGSCHEGMTMRMNGEMLFIESERMFPVGSELTVSLAPNEGQSAAEELAEGIVVWHCPLGDEYENKGGFGVRLKRRWPKGPVSDMAGGPKEAA